MGLKEEPIPQLVLPKRWELLAQRAKDAGLDVSQFVERVDEAASHIDELLDLIQRAGGGLFEVIYGLSGSGKTTFLNTLPKFFEKVRVLSFQRERDLADLPDFVRETYIEGDEYSRIILIERRDIPKKTDLDALEEMLAELLNAFREPYGKVLVLWPITNLVSAERISEVAWETGRDSITDPKTRGKYVFKGVPKERYYDLADLTTRNLTGDGLDAFGVDRTSAKDVLKSCTTIADFYSEIDNLASKRREKTFSVLKARVQAKLWILLPGDEITAVNTTVAALTQGARSRIDIDKMGELLDDPKNKALYVADWRTRRADLAHLLRAVDVRLFSVPPNVALAAIRTFGDSSLKKVLKQPALNQEQAKNTLRASRFYKSILEAAGIETTAYAGSRELKAETRDEYNRVQALAVRQDKLLNKALGDLLAACLSEDAPSLEVVTEKKGLPGSQLKPDIQIKLAEGEYICLEPTWRSTGAGIEGERLPTQSTLSEAFVQKYVLDKTLQYIKDLGL